MTSEMLTPVSARRARVAAKVSKAGRANAGLLRTPTSKRGSKGSLSSNQTRDAHKVAPTTGNTTRASTQGVRRSETFDATEVTVSTGIDATRLEGLIPLTPRSTAFAGCHRACWRWGRFCFRPPGIGCRAGSVAALPRQGAPRPRPSSDQDHEVLRRHLVLRTRPVRSRRRLTRCWVRRPSGLVIALEDIGIEVESVRPQAPSPMVRESPASACETPGELQASALVTTGAWVRSGWPRSRATAVALRPRGGSSGSSHVL